MRVMMTPSATQFVGAVTFRALTGYPAAVDQWSDLSERGEHIALAQFAELIVVAPATAHNLAQVAAGLCGDLVTTTLAAARGPVLFAPAMNTHMWLNPITQGNVARLRELGYHFVMPEEGRLACGEVGPGRLAEPETIRQAILDLLAPATGPLAGKRVLITSGPTREWLDPVRFLSNPSSGKMGAALAQVAAARGAQVTLISGPGTVPPPPGVTTIAVESAADMERAVQEHLPGTDVFIGAAAVADYRPEVSATQKQKKSAEPLELRLTPTPDILQAVAAAASRPAVVVGFAAETEDLEAHAREKLERKRLDLIVANDLTRPAAGFAVDTNEVLILDAAGAREFVTCRPKAEVAAVVLDHVERRLSASAS
jgi:phosphopantothenoylcysteine decarboxylase/phosphopantothenate--cysteine ligase